jgi:hypothetical protein
MSTEKSINTEEKKFFTPEVMGELHVIAQDFAKHLQQVSKEKDAYSLDDPNVELGLNLGIRAVVVLLNEYLLDTEGKVQIEMAKKIASHIKDKLAGKTF